MSIGTRLARIEEERLTAAIAGFATWWKGNTLNAARQERVRAHLRQAGCTGFTREDIDRWHATRSPEHRAIYDTLEAVIMGIVERPHQRQAITDALARLAPHLDRSPHDSPITIIHTLRATIAGDARIAGEIEGHATRDAHETTANRGGG
jgi:hypothetical protein